MYFSTNSDDNQSVARYCPQRSFSNIENIVRRRQVIFSVCQLKCSFAFGKFFPSFTVSSAFRQSTCLIQLPAPPLFCISIKRTKNSISKRNWTLPLLKNIQSGVDRVYTSDEIFSFFRRRFGDAFKRKNEKIHRNNHSILFFIYLTYAFRQEDLLELDPLSRSVSWNFVKFSFISRFDETTWNSTHSRSVSWDFAKSNREKRREGTQLFQTRFRNPTRGQGCLNETREQRLKEKRNKEKRKRKTSNARIHLSLSAHRDPVSCPRSVGQVIVCICM